MKKFPLFLAAAASALTMSLSAQTVFTTPAGYVTLSVPGATNANEPSTALFSNLLGRELIFSGSAASSSPNSLAVSTASFTASSFEPAPNTPPSHFVVLNGGNFDGAIFDITTNTVDSVTLNSNSFDLNGLTNQEFRIYRHASLDSIFGVNPTLSNANGGSDMQGGATSQDADNIILIEGNGSFSTFFYEQRSDPFTGDVSKWTKIGSSLSNIGLTPIKPGSGAIFIRRSTDPLDVTIFGEVFDTNIGFEVSDGTNFVAIPDPIQNSALVIDPMADTETITIGRSGLRPDDVMNFDTSIHLKGGATSDIADNILVWNGISYEVCFFEERSDPFTGDVARWVNLSRPGVDASNVSLQTGSFFIIRRAATSTFRWVLPVANVLPSN